MQVLKKGFNYVYVDVDFKISKFTYDDSGWIFEISRPKKGKKEIRFKK